MHCLSFSCSFTGGKPNQVVVEPSPLGWMLSCAPCLVCGLCPLSFATITLYLFWSTLQVPHSFRQNRKGSWQIPGQMYLFECKSSCSYGRCAFTLHCGCRAGVGVEVSGSSWHWAAARRAPVIPAALELAAIPRPGAQCFSRIQSQPVWSSSSCSL